jgi:NAD(P)-dependent dehydrogenase (short-subunit alcohol dehydrogenase family)
MASTSTAPKDSTQPPLERIIHQSPRIDLTKPYDQSQLKGQTILITGGASGFGAAFARSWAAQGAYVVLADINSAAGESLASSIRTDSGNKHVYFVHVDVTDWDSQVAMFKEAVRLSPLRRIDTVVANAGVAGPDMLGRWESGEAAAENPSKPRFKMLDVNLTGVAWTVHLAFWWLGKDNDEAVARFVGEEAKTAPSTDDDKKNTAGSVTVTETGQDSPNTSDAAVQETPRDRHILLLGSIASMFGLPGQPQYNASKHAVLGLFRSLRASSFLQGIRVNCLFPYFIDTPMVTGGARILLAGGTLGRVEDVVEAGTRLTADREIRGRGLVVGPRVRLREVETKDGLEYEYVPTGTEREGDGSAERALWEPYAGDWEDCEAFCRRMIGLLNTVEKTRGWIGWAKDMIGAFGYGIGMVRKGRRFV